MALVVADRVWETTSTSGVGTLTLSGAVSGYRTFAAIGNGNTTYYTITNGTDFEVGIGTYTSSGTTLSRDTVLTSSLGGTTKINVTPGSFVFVDYPAEKAVYEDASGNVDGYLITGGTINNTTIGATTASAGTFSTLSNNSSVTMSTTASNISIGTSQVAPTLILGGTAQTGTITVGRSTATQTTNIQAGATASGSTKTMNIGTAGVSGSTTTINIGSAVSGSLGTTTIQAPTVNIGQTATQFQVTNTASAVNFVQVTGSATGVAPVLSSQGSDTNISLVLQPKGTGTLQATGNFSVAGAITGQTGRLNGTGQNLLVRSEDFSNASWGKTSVTVTANSTIAPDGTTTADTLTATAADSACFQGVTTSSVGLTYTFSVFLRADSATNISIAFYDTPSFNPTLVACAVTTSWQRFSVTRTLGSGSTGIQATIGGNSTFSTGESVYAWGAQVELGSTLNTYIPTTTTAVYGTPTLSFSGVSTLGLESNGALFLQPAGTGAIQAQATTSTTAGGNVRGANAVDWQTSRNTDAARVASGQFSVIAGGTDNRSTSFATFVGGGQSNTASASIATVAGGFINNATAYGTFIGSGSGNTAAGFFNFIGGGFTNSGTANAAVTTQSGTMNATTAVTLSGSNANIKVGQYISGTSIASDTYVAAISGTALTLSKVASGSSTSTLSFFTPHGVVVGGGNNQATGSYSFIGGGGDAGTASNRNVASGDFSVVVGGFKNTASVINSFVGGGEANTASGFYSSILGGGGNGATNSYSVCIGGAGNSASGFGSTTLGGNGNVANGTYAVAGGFSSNNRSISTFAFAAGNTSVSGDAQTEIFVLRSLTTDATATALRLNTSAAGTTNQVILPNNSAYYFIGEIVSGVTGGGATKGFSIEGVIKRGANAASTVLVGTPTVTSTYADAGAAAFTIAVTADTTNGGLRITFTGVAATTIRTVAQIRTTEMTF